MKKNEDHFYHIFWFIVGICVFGAGLSVYAITVDPVSVHTSLTFWQSTAVAGGIGYLIGSSVARKQERAAAAAGTASAEVSATITSTPENPES